MLYLLTMTFLLGLTTLVAGQASTTVEQSMPPTATAGFNLAPITEQERFQWCLAQQNNCPQICGGQTRVNSCAQSDLTYSCICSNGTVPDVSAYQDTIPFYKCQQTYVQCIQAHPNDAQGQDGCKKNQKCGTLNATASDTGSSSASSSASSSNSAASISSATGSASAASSPSATPTNRANAVSQQVATGLFAVVFAIAFKLLF